MKFKFRGHTYNLILKGRILPVGIEEIVPELYDAPQNYPLLINGNKLEGRVAIVTGGHKGIGYHIAMRLLKEGAKVIITGRDEDSLRKATKFLNTPNLQYIVWDISDGQENKHFQDAINIFGRIDILVNNAGINKVNGAYMTFEEASRDYIHAINDVNVMGTIRMCECFINSSSQGTILNIISNTSIRAAIGIYWMAKWALYDYTKGLSLRLQNTSSITVNGICPGPTKTDMMSEVTSNICLPSMANKRFGMPEEIAEISFVTLLAGLNGKTGEILICDGGETLI